MVVKCLRAYLVWCGVVYVFGVMYKCVVVWCIHVVWYFFVVCGVKNKYSVE